MTTQKQFKDFLTDIEPSSTTKSNASSRHTELRDFLAKDTDYSPYHIQTFLSGSYKRDTAIRPKQLNGVLQRPDVDIIVVADCTLQDDPILIIDETFKAVQRLKNSKESYTKIRRQARSIGVETTTVDMDVVPIIAPNGLDSTLYIANRKYETESEKWLITNPPGHTEWTTKINKESDNRFKHLVKLMKWWRRENPTISKRPKGFMIECIVAECFDKNETNYEKLVLGTLNEIVRKYELWVTLGIVPSIQDPSVPGNNVLSNVSFAAFEGFYKKVKRHAEIGQQILDETDEEKELELWQQIFGSRFPKSKANTRSTLKEAAKVPSYTFPNRPITPKKPGGFA